jgi:predicted permease
MILREARRFLQSSPLLSLSAVAVLALGIGASALALALLLAFSSLTYPGMRSLGYATIAEQTEGGGSVPISWNRFEKLRTQPGQDVSLAAYSAEISTTLEINGQSGPLKIAAVSRGFFSVFTPGLRAGRDFTAMEEGQTGRHVAILSVPFATRLFKSPEAALNQFVAIKGLPFRVVGVAPAGFEGLFGKFVQVWVPANCVIPLKASVPAWMLEARPTVWKQLPLFYGLAASDRASSAKLTRQLSSSLALHPTSAATLHISEGLTTDPARDAKVRKWLRLGLLLALIFTLVSALNYALLLLARTPGYAEEVRLKKALGAGSGRLITELMIGPAITVGAGLVAASVFWAGGLMLIARMSPFYEQLVHGSWRAALVAFAIQVPIACALTLIIALIPAIGLIRDDGAPRMGYASTATRRAGSLLQGVVTLQIACCIGTWILAGMIVAAVISVTNQPLGFAADHLAVVSVGAGPKGVSFVMGPNRSFPPAPSVESLIEHLTAVPGVRSVSFASDAPFASPMGTIKVRPANDASATPVTVDDTTVSPGYFRTLGSRIIEGRGFNSPNLTGDTNEVVINESLAKELWPAASPVGRSVTLISPGYEGKKYLRNAIVVGVVGNMRFSGYSETPEPAIFESLGTEFAIPGFYLIVNGSASLHALQTVASAQIAAQIPQLAVQHLYSIAGRAQASRWKVEKRAYFALGGALLMALIAYIGLYGTLAYYVNTRRRELAIRICLGAMPWALRKIVLVRAARCALLAMFISAPLWAVLAQLSSSEYLGSVSWSTGRAVLLALACVAVAIFISLIPAAAATRVSPAKVLKEL